MRRRKLWWFLAPVLAIEVFALWYRLPPRVSWENAWVIEKGKTRDEVERILGTPEAESRNPNNGTASSWVAHWRSSAAWVNVTFDAADHVERVQIENLRFRGRSEGFDPFDRLIRLWHRWFP